MEKELVHGPIGAVGEYDVDIRDGKLVAGVEFPLSPVVDKLFAKAKAAIPGQYDDVLLDGIRMWMKSALGV